MTDNNPNPEVSRDDFDTFFQHYLVAALWSSTDNADESGGEPLDSNYSIEDIDDDGLEVLRAHAQSFWFRMYYFINSEDQSEFTCCAIKQAGHDFWLTQNGHGCGFLDGDWPKYGKMFDQLSEAYPRIDLGVEDGTIYVN